MKDKLTEDNAIDDTASVIAAAIRKHVERAQKAAEAELETLAAQHRQLVSETDKLQGQLRRSQQEMTALVAERVELKRQLQDAIDAKAIAETRYEQLVAASQQLTEGLSRTLHEQRAQATQPPVPAARTNEPAAPSKNAAAPFPPAANAATVKKKPLQFAGPARDAKRVKIRQGTYVSVDGIPGELVDMSLGGAQAVLRQMVKPNQLVRLTIPTAGERLICRGRIVWVVYEQPGTSMSVYRTGVKFTDRDTDAVEDFMQRFAEESPGRRSSSEIA